MEEANSQNPTKNPGDYVVDVFAKNERRVSKTVPKHGVGHISPQQDKKNIFKLKQQQFRQRLQQLQLLRRRTEVKNITNVMGAGVNMEIVGRTGMPPVCVRGAVSPIGTINSSWWHGGPIPPRQGPGNLPPMNQWQSVCQSGPQAGQTQGPLPSGLMQQANPEVSTAGANTEHVLEQLFIALKSRLTPEQQQRILHILKANPPLLAAFIKQRQETVLVEATQIGSTSVAGNVSQQLPHILVQQQARQYSNRMQALNVLQDGPGQGGAAGRPGMQNQQIMRVQQQQQRLPGIRRSHPGYINQFEEQNFAPMAGLKPAPPPVPSPQGAVMEECGREPPQKCGYCGILLQQQQHQLIQSVRNSPPITSPQPVPSPRGLQLSPHELNEMDASTVCNENE